MAEYVPKKTHYIDNNEFMAAMVAYRKEVNRAKRLKQPRPPITEYIGGCLLKIANHLSYLPKFCRYPFLDEMIADGVENSLIYAHNFDPKKSNNPFWYFSQITYRAFVRRIKREKRQLDIKNRYVVALDLDTMILQAQDEGEYNNPFIQYLKEQADMAAVVPVSKPVSKPAKKLPRKGKK